MRIVMLICLLAGVQQSAMRPTSQPASRKADVEGWTASPNAAGAKRASSAPSTLSAEEQKRFDAVAVALLRAMKADDKSAYRELHSDAGWNSSIDWWQALFARQRANFGPLVRAYPCIRGQIRFGKYGYDPDLKDSVSFVAVFEERVAGVFSFRLNADGKIDATSVYIKEELREYHPEGVKPIWPPDEKP